MDRAIDILGLITMLLGGGVLVAIFVKYALPDIRTYWRTK